MIGHGQYRGMTYNLTETGSPHVRQVWFDSALRRRCGARLVWNHDRRVFCVIRPRGRHSHPISYIDIGVEQFPMTHDLLSSTVSYVRFSDAQRHKDVVAMLDEVNRIDQEKLDQDRDDFVPEMTKDMNRHMEIVSNITNGGRIPQRFFDMGAAN